MFPGPVFVEFPIDVLYKYAVVAKEIGMKDNSKSLGQKVVNWSVFGQITKYLLLKTWICAMHVTLFWTQVPAEPPEQPVCWCLGGA